MLPCVVVSNVGKVRRNGYIFFWFVGDHAPIHIHIAKDGREICKWALFEQREISGKANKKLRDTIEKLRLEGAFKELEKLKKDD